MKEVTLCGENQRNGAHSYINGYENTLLWIQGLSQPTVQPSFGRPFSNLDGLLKKTAFGRFAIMVTPFGRLGKSCRVPYNKILC